MNRKTSVIGLIVLIGCAACVPADEASAQQYVDSIATAIRVKTLESRRAELRQRIQEEDAKRGRVVEGITPEANERMCRAQDSVCLSLRSQLVSVELELDEIAPGAPQEVLTNKLDILRRRAAKIPTDAKEQ